MNPIISIIVPSYNEEKNIEKCLKSICNQTFKDFEVLCIDDNSTDNTFEIIKEWAQKDNRIIPLKNTGKGVSSARNYGLKNAKGDYIGFVDSDDSIQPQMYEFLYKASVESNADFSYCKYKKCNEFVPSFFTYQCSVIKSENMKKNTIDENIYNNVWNKLFKYETVKALRFENYVIGEDSRFSVNVIIKKTDIVIANVDLPLYCYYINNNSVTNKIDGLKMYQNILTKFDCFELLKTDFKKVAYYYLEQGFYYLTKYKLKYGFGKDNYKKKIINLYYKYILSYLKSPYAGIYDKTYVVFSYLFPKLYKLITKKK